MQIPSGRTDLLTLAKELREILSASRSQRIALCRAQNAWVQTGRAGGSRATVNRLYGHIDKLSSHLFSPAELRFAVEFESHYDSTVTAQGQVAARLLTGEWERKDLDILFGAGVGVSLEYGAAIFKQMWSEKDRLEAQVLMPWNFGVYREDINSLDDQEALGEFGMLTIPQLWKHVRHLPDAKRVYEQARAHASRDNGEQANTSFFHNVLSTSILNTDLASTRQQPGGIVQLSSDVSQSIVGPQTAVELVPFVEMYVKDDDSGDYVTMMMIEPDILISPRIKKENMFAPDTQPYSLIQANYVPGYVWGRSEVVDLQEPQGLLAQWWDDVRRLTGVQVDRILAFSGGNAITDESYAAFRASGFISLEQGASVNDLTPPFPPVLFESLAAVNKAMDDVSGLGNILSGQGESGVRAGVHADTLMKAASPRLRDRSLLIERQCAAAADKTLELLQAKDGRAYKTETGGEFLLHDLPDDRRVSVDSHSSSPVFADDHQQLVAFGVKAGFIDGEGALDLLPYPRKDVLKQRYKAMQEAKAKMVQEHPELLTHGKGHR